MRLHYVGNFDVSVAYALPVHVVKALQELLNHVTGNILRVKFIIEVFFEIHTQELHDQVEVLAVFKDLEERNNFIVADAL